MVGLGGWCGDSSEGVRSVILASGRREHLGGGGFRSLAVTEGGWRGRKG